MGFFYEFENLLIHLQLKRIKKESLPAYKLWSKGGGKKTGQLKSSYLIKIASIGFFFARSEMSC